MELVIWIVIGTLVGALIGQAKGRIGAGLFFGLLLGPIGWLITALGPNKKPKCPFCSGAPPEECKAIKDIMGSVPPEHLRKRTHGDECLSSFENIGRVISSDIHSSINSIIELGEHCRILDFGCGCGRVIKYFHESSANSRLYGTDIDEDVISWCQHHLSHIGEFITNEESPPLPFGDDFFDFVYSISVFTHLPEDMQFAWLEELRRVTKRGGYLLLTTHGEELFQTTSEEDKRQFREKGFYYSVGSGTEGLPDFYQTSFHTKDYIYSHWSKFFEIKKIIKKGIANHQDLILCFPDPNICIFLFSFYLYRK